MEIGLVQGRVKGREEKARELVLRQLGRKFGVLSPRLQDRIAALSPEQTDALAGDLLDFAVPADLDAWLSADTPQ